MSALNIKISMKNFEWKEIPILSLTDSFYWRHLFYCVHFFMRIMAVFSTFDRDSWEKFTERNVFL